MGVKWPWCGVDHPAPYSAANERVQSYTSTPPLSLHRMSQKDLYLSPLGEPCHRYTNGYRVLRRHDLKQANWNSNAGNHQTTVHYKPDLHMVHHPRCLFINYNWIIQLSNTTIWWLDICCLLHRYQPHVSAIMAIFKLID